MPWHTGRSLLCLDNQGVSAYILHPILAFSPGFLRLNFSAQARKNRLESGAIQCVFHQDRLWECRFVLP